MKRTIRQLKRPRGPRTGRGVVFLMQLTGRRPLTVRGVLDRAAKARGITGHAERAMDLLARAADAADLLDVGPRPPAGDPVDSAGQPLPRGVHVPERIGQLVRPEPLR